MTDQEARLAILDVCCGSRAMWFDREDSRCLFIDKRREVHEVKRSGTPRSPVVIAPELQADFSRLPFASGMFKLVVYDPPHMVRNEARGNLTKFYGVLNGDWRKMLRRGFSECFRVLEPSGILIFKWNELEIPLRDILSLTPEKPLFGHKSGALARTHWCVFMKAPLGNVA